MEIQKIKAIIEAILFAAGRIVTQEELVLALEIDKNGLLLENYISCGITSPLGICDNDEYRDKYIAKTYIYELVGNSLNLIDTKYETTKDYCEKTNE